MERQTPDQEMGTAAAEYAALGAEMVKGPELHEVKLSEDELDELVNQRFDNDLTGLDLLDRLNSARQDRKLAAEAEIVEQIRSLRHQMGEAIRAELNMKTLEQQASEDEADRLVRVQERVASVSTDDDENVALMKLGMMDTDGKFTFDEQLFSPKTAMLWDAYIDLVKRFDELSRESRALGPERSEINMINRMRTDAHDTLTRSVMEDLFVGEANFNSTRRLVAKMRDEKYPGTGETGIASRLAKGLLDRVRADAA